ncbi:hypothetical protein ACWJJH_03280 [Endozoicomonadaceae bacterium StTr2]
MSSIYLLITSVVSLVLLGGISCNVSAQYRNYLILAKCLDSYVTEHLKKETQTAGKKNNKDTYPIVGYATADDSCLSLTAELYLPLEQVTLRYFVMSARKVCLLVTPRKSHQVELAAYKYTEWGNKIRSRHGGPSVWLKSPHPRWLEIDLKPIAKYGWIRAESANSKSDFGRMTCSFHQKVNINHIYFQLPDFMLEPGETFEDRPITCLTSINENQFMDLAEALFISLMLPYIWHQHFWLCPPRHPGYLLNAFFPVDKALQSQYPGCSSPLFYEWKEVNRDVWAQRFSKTVYAAYHPAHPPQQQAVPVAQDQYPQYYVSDHSYGDGGSMGYGSESGSYQQLQPVPPPAASTAQYYSGHHSHSSAYYPPSDPSSYPPSYPPSFQNSYRHGHQDSYSGDYASSYASSYSGNYPQPPLQFGQQAGYYPSQQTTTVNGSGLRPTSTPAFSVADIIGQTERLTLDHQASSTSSYSSAVSGNGHRPAFSTSSHPQAKVTGTHSPPKTITTTTLTNTTRSAFKPVNSK